MKKYIIRKIIALSMSVMLLIQFAPYAKAAPLPEGFHQYATQSTNKTNYGGSFFLPAGETQLLSNYSPSNQESFITHEMWLLFGTNNEQWVEIGAVKGCTNDIYTSGYFAAVCNGPLDTDYTEYSLQKSGSGVVLKLQHDGNKVWGAYIGSAMIRQLWSNYGVAQTVNVGVETSDTGNIFTSGMTGTQLQYKSTSNIWTNFTSFNNYDRNQLGWTSSYNSGTNTITYTR